MENLDEITNDLSNKRKEQQIKYVYYLIALCVSAIGYSIYRTVGHSFNFLLILWGLPLISWGVSTYFGLLFLRKSIHHIDDDMMLVQHLRALRNNLELEAKQFALKGVAESEIKLVQNLITERKHFKYQTILFFTGIALFIFWHLAEMCILTFPEIGF